MRGIGLLAMAFLLAVPVVAGPKKSVLRFKTWQEAGPPEKCVDVLFVGDGYQRKHLTPKGKYWKDVQRYARRLFKEPPFEWYRAKFRVRAAFLESKDKGCKQSPDDQRHDTALKSQFDSAEGRLLAFTDPAALKEVVVAAGAVDIVFVMVNVERYGGAGSVLHAVRVRGGALPAPTFAAQDTSSFLIAIHELGHSLAGLADGYVDEETAAIRPLPETGEDLPHANATLKEHIDLKNFKTIQQTAKWKHFLSLPGAKRRKWAHEGGYFRERGVFRPWRKCMMRARGDPFCPVCCEEMSKAILAACGEAWDDVAWHKKYPLRLWK
ncbi:MAG: M64 family metallopeptidase [Planctomycetota bacterium]